VCTFVQVRELQQEVSFFQSKTDKATISASEVAKANTALKRTLAKRDDEIRRLQESYANLEADFARTQEVLHDRERAIRAEEQELRARFEHEATKQAQALKKLQETQAAGREELAEGRATLIRDQRRLELKRERWNKVWNEKQPALLNLELELEAQQERKQQREEAEAAAAEEEKADIDMTTVEAEQKEPTAHRRRGRPVSRSPDVELGPAAAVAASAALASAVLGTPPRSAHRPAVGSLSKKSTSSAASAVRAPPSSLERITPPHSRAPTPERTSREVGVDVSEAMPKQFARHTKSTLKKNVARRSVKRAVERSPSPSRSTLASPATDVTYSSHAPKRARLVAPLALAREPTEMKVVRKVVKSTRRAARE
jgi:hypothetical protein